MSLAPLPTLKTEKILGDVSSLPYPSIGQPQNVKVSTEQARLSELENMLKEAQNRAVIAEQEAYDKAYTAGEKAGLTLGEKRAEQILLTMEQVLEQAEVELKNIQEKTVEVVTEISKAVVHKVLGEKEVDSYLEELIFNALQRFDVELEHGITLAVNAKDLEMFERMVNLPKGIRIQSNTLVSRGSCQLLSIHHDALINPEKMIDKAVAHIKAQLSMSQDV